MTSQELQNTVQDLISFLQALDKVIPNKVDTELISFLCSLNNNTWLYDLLLSAINSQAQATKYSVKR